VLGPTNVSHIPDLWRAGEDAAHLYPLYLARLSMGGLRGRVVSSCRRIRRYARRGPGAEKGLFTFSFEIDSLCDLGEYKAAWRQLRLRDRMALGTRFDLARRDLSAADAGLAEWDYAPILFFLGRYRRGCSLLEASLDFRFADAKVRSYDILFRVYNGDEEPRNRCRVTLAHFYARTGKSLRDWRHWEAFVRGFHPRLFRLAGVRREELLADPGRLRAFRDKLMEIRKDRATSGVSRGQADLIESPGKVREWHEATQHKLDRLRERIGPAMRRTDAKLRQLFPELTGTPE
jgi:hypothetical protein